MRKIFIIPTVILTILLILSLGFLYIRRNRDTVPVPAPENTVSDENPAQKILAQEVVSAVPSFNGERVWYLTLDGKILSVNLESGAREEFILPETIKNPSDVQWQEKGSDFIVAQNIDGHLRYTYVRASDKQLSQYPDNIREPVILAGDARIAYDWVIGDNHELKISDINSSNFAKIGDLFRSDYRLVAHPRKLELVMFANATTSPLIHVDLAASTFSNIADNGRYENIRFSPDGSKLLVSENKAGVLVFWFYDFATKQRKDFSIASTDFAIWSRDSGGVIFATNGLLKEENTRTGDVKDWGSFPGGPVRDAFLHPFKDILFYIDGAGNLYSLELSP